MFSIHRIAKQKPTEELQSKIARSCQITHRGINVEKDYLEIFNLFIITFNFHVLLISRNIKQRREKQSFFIDVIISLYF